MGTFEDAVRIAAEMSGITGEPTIVKERERVSLIERIIDGYTHSDLESITEELKNEFVNQPLLQYKFEY